MRPSRHQAFIDTARVWAKRSTCFRLNVGAVVAQRNRLVSTGYNGAPSGEAHCIGHDCPGADRCERTKHAEENAIERIPQDIVEFPGPFQLYSTYSPCSGCVSLIGEFNRKGPRRIEAVFFENYYRDSTAVLALLSKNVQVYIITPAGYLVDTVKGKVLEVP